MTAQIFTQFTPNPNALKFILDVPVSRKGGVSYKDPAQCDENVLASILIKLNHVKEVYFFENFITVTQDGFEDWELLENKVKEVISTNIASHNPDTVVSNAVPTTAAPTDDEMGKINDILDQTIRPALQMDGGDVRLVNLSNHVLQITYRGACGSCPSAAFGTLRAIEQILQEKYDPQLRVELAYN